MKRSEKIKLFAAGLGFDACGICKAEFVGDHADYLKTWLQEGKNAGMGYMSNHFDKRVDPSLLIENAKSVIVVALNYFPAIKRSVEDPQISYYAYGKDYHGVVKNRLRKLLEYINQEISPANGRVFCDSAPILEKYHAQKAGIGWIGKHTQLIIPHKGSYFFLGTLLLDIELPYDAPMESQCGSCTKCMEACPTEALEKPCCLNAGKCLSYLTIEHAGEIPFSYASRLGNRVYGCDTCNQACPWNKFALPGQTPELQPSSEFLQLKEENLKHLSETDFNRIFKDSPLKRAGYHRLMRNVSLVCDAANRHDQ